MARSKNEKKRASRYIVTISCLIERHSALYNIYRYLSLTSVSWRLCGARSATLLLKHTTQFK
jgi:hypothetical protein